MVIVIIHGHMCRCTSHMIDEGMLNIITSRLLNAAMTIMTMFTIYSCMHRFRSSVISGHVLDTATWHDAMFPPRDW